MSSLGGLEVSGRKARRVRGLRVQESHAPHHLQVMKTDWSTDNPRRWETLSILGIWLESCGGLPVTPGSRGPLRGSPWSVRGHLGLSELVISALSDVSNSPVDGGADNSFQMPIMCNGLRLKMTS